MNIRPRQNGRHFSDGIFKCIFLNYYVWITIKIFRWSLFLGSIKQYTSIGSDNDLAPARRQAIIWSNDG